MKNRIVFYSGGKASFAIAAWVKKHYPKDNIVLYFTDTKWEDEDLYRFLYEGADKLELPMLIHSEGKNPKQLMEEDNFLYNSRIANCSVKLKARVAKRFIKRGIKPLEEKWYNKNKLKRNDFTDKPILYFGIDYKEAHRTSAITKNWKPFDVRFPAVDEDIDNNEILKKYGIKQPRLYDRGFAHNNCAGRCIKGGQGHWKQLYDKDYEKFAEMRDFELKMNKAINKHHRTNKTYSFLKKKKKPYTLEQLEKDIEEQPEQIDLFDIGACGCFVDEDNIKE